MDNYEKSREQRSENRDELVLNLCSLLSLLSSNHHYSDKADDKGFFIFSTDDLYQWISAADKEQFQVMVHAIGDHAIHALLNIYAVSYTHLTLPTKA